MAKNTKIYTVSEISWLIKETIENSFPARLTITGEITNWKGQHSSGHCYFSLKDADSQLPCVMWAGRFKYVKFRPKNGMAVIIKGKMGVYAPSGKYQFYAETMEPEGIGSLQLAFEQMYKRLKAEGLFDDEHKKALPAYPMRIGIVTSETGAAVQDIKKSIQDRWSCAKLFLYPVTVQGQGAANQIADAINDINKRNSKLKLDILIVGRGGGSMEDLWAFNEEPVARAIYNSDIPVISAVGHEIDTTIADMVADARASTPTKAGVVTVPDGEVVLEQLRYMEENMQSRLDFLIGNAIQRTDETGTRLKSIMKELLDKIQIQLHIYREQTRKIEPHRLLKDKTLSLNNLKNRIETEMKTVINKTQIQLTAQTNRLAGLNPKSVLQRGYSIATNKKSGKVIRSGNDIRPGEVMVTELAGENLIESKVIKK